jgi:hypothetical protein
LADRVRVLVLGGYGFFGRRLVERLVLQPGLEIIVAGRSAAKGEALVRDMASSCAGSPLSNCVLDTQAAGFAQELAALGPRIVVHTAGPFQGQAYDVAKACIAAHAHYVDLADGRAFVAGIGILDAQARDAGVAVLSGASSVPALSSAVVDELAAGMRGVEHIDIGVSPGNQTERGLSTVQAILSYCGRAIDNTDGDHVFGWYGSWRHDYPLPVGPRLLSPCDVPDLLLLPRRYPGLPRVRFGAGLELRFLHRAMNAMAWLVRKGWVSGWERHARSLKRLSELFLAWGTDVGAMHVSVRGRDADGNALAREWVLIGMRGDGPYVPVLAGAALVAELASGRAVEPGARPCVGVLASSQILAQAEGLAITAHEIAGRGLYESAMGPAYERLHATVRAFHDLSGNVELHGEVETDESRGALGAFIARLLGAPRVKARGAIRFELRAEGRQETWIRHFPHRTMASTLRLHGTGVVEMLGAARLTFALEEEGGGLVMVLRSMRFLGIPCPRWLMPRIHAREHGRDGRLHFDVRASVPLVGQVTGYRGWLQLPGKIT